MRKKAKIFAKLLKTANLALLGLNGEWKYVEHGKKGSSRCSLNRKLVILLLVRDLSRLAEFDVTDGSDCE